MLCCIYFLQQPNKVYLKQYKEGVSKNIPCHVLLRVTVIRIILICKEFFKNMKTEKDVFENWLSQNFNISLFPKRGRINLR